MNPNRKGFTFPDLNTPGDPRLLDAVHRRTPNIAGGGITHTQGGTIIEPRKVRRVGRSASSPCPFGEIIRWKDGETTKTGIRGGIINAGNKHWTVPPQELNLSSEGEWIVYIELDVTANRDDDEEILLPGLETSAEPPEDWGKTSDPDEDENYPDDTPPEVPSGEGTVVIPLGRLVIEDGSASFTVAGGCGNITVNHCAGSFTTTRG